MTPREVAEPNIVLRCVVGSTAHGLALEGTDDRDEMAVCIEPAEFVIGNARVVDGDGIRRKFGQWVYRTAEERLEHDPKADQRRHGRTPRSVAGDTDLVAYSLRKYCHLAANGNPTVLLLLFAKPEESTSIGRKLQGSAEMFASRQAGHRFLGYLQAQRERLLGERGQMRVTRSELVETHGYDTKFAMHAVRLGYQGVEYLRTGRLTLPMVGHQREVCMAIRRGEETLAYVVELIKEIEARLQACLEDSPLPEHPDLAAIDAFLVESYQWWWML